MRRRAERLLLATLLCAAGTQPGTERPPTHTGEAEQGVDPELLEFLGEWEADDGEWIDPTTLEEAFQVEPAPSHEERTDE